jgi:hypothetical protein
MMGLNSNFCEVDQERLELEAAGGDFNPVFIIDSLILNGPIRFENYRYPYSYSEKKIGK